MLSFDNYAKGELYTEEEMAEMDKFRMLPNVVHEVEVTITGVLRKNDVRGSVHVLYQHGLFSTLRHCFMPHL